MAHTKRPLLGAFVAGALIVAQVRPAWADCTYDAQCKGDRICEKGQCVTPPPKPATPVAPPPATPAPTPPAPPPAPAAAGPATPPAGSTHVQFEGRDNALVKMEAQGVTRGECRMPCSLDLQPGEYTVHTRGFDQEIEVSKSPASVQFRKSCLSCYILGGIFTGLSIPIFAGAAALISHHSSKNAGYGVATAGGIVAASGITLLVLGIVVGGSKVVVRDDKDDASSSAPRYATVPTRLAFSESGVGFSF